MTHSQTYRPRQLVRHLCQVSCLAIAFVTAPASTWGQSLTFSDLKGYAIEVRLLRQQTVRRGGKESSNQAQTDMRIVIDSAGVLLVTVSPTGYGKKGVRKARPVTGPFTLDETKKMYSLGGGYGIWTFENDTLTYLRIYQGGALKRNIAFARRDGGLSCKASEAMIREAGVGGIIADSPFDGTPRVIITAKHISSSCSVTTSE
jgi:hypothetical protein